jgi:hypothetical protein
MYANSYSVTALAAFGTVASISGWTVAGWCIIAFAVAAAVAMTARRLTKQNRE